MKQHAHAKSFIWGLVILFLFLINCGPGEKSTNKQVVVQLVNSLKGLMPAGFNFETELEKSRVKPLENNRYLVTLKNSLCSSDFTAVLKYLFRIDLFMKDDPPGELETFTIDEAVMVYDPKKEDIDLEYVRGIRVHRDFSKMVRKGDQAKGIMDWLIKWNIKEARLYIGNVIFENFNIKGSQKIETGETSKNSGFFNPKNQLNPKITVEDIHLNLDCVPNISIDIEIKGIKDSEERFENEEVGRYVEQKNAPLPDIEEILQLGLPISDSRMEFVKVTISIKKDGNQWISGTFDSIFQYSFFKPDKTRTHFNFCIGLGLKNLKLSFPYKRKIEGFMQLGEGGFSISLEKINPGMVLPLAKFTRNLLELRDSADEKKIRELMMVEVMKIWDEMMKSKPLKYSFNLDLKNLKLANLEEKKYELLSDIKECAANFSVDNVNAKSILAMMEYSKKAAEGRNLFDKQKIIEYMQTEGKRLWAEMVQSGMVIEYSISPLKHYFGEFSIESKFQMNPMAVKSSIKIKKIDEVFNKLKEANLISPFTLMFIRQGLQQIAVRDENGNASIVMEMRADQPGIIFVNGMPMKIPPSMFKSQMPGFGF